MNRSCLHSFLLPSPWRGPPGGHLSLEVQPGTTFARDELDCAVQPVSGRAGPCRRARRPGGGCKTTSRTVRAQRGPFGRSSSNRVSPSRALTCSNKGKKKKKTEGKKKKKTSNAPVSYRPADDPVGRGRGGSRGTVPTPPPPPPEGPVTLTYHCIRDMHWRGRRRRNRTKGAAPPPPPQRRQFWQCGANRQCRVPRQCQCVCSQPQLRGIEQTRPTGTGPLDLGRSGEATSGPHRF